MAEIRGTVRATRSGIAFLAPDAGGEDLLIAPDGMHGALHGDTVRATLRRSHSDYRPQAVIEEILERPILTYTGNVDRLGRGWIVRPDSPLLPEAMPLRSGDETPTVGSKVIFRVETAVKGGGQTVGIFDRVIGEADDARLDPIVIAMEFGLATRFSDLALSEAEARASQPGPEADRDREDFREQFVVTIDPIDAKDFDDAIALRRLDDGGYELWVHIADVSAYIPEDGPLDLEARARGTSVYFPGSVIPMLPETISNQAASLTPGEDKRVFSAAITFDSDARPIRSRFARGWMVSRARLHYAQAQRVFSGEESAEPAVTELLVSMDELARKLRARRFRQGAFDLDVPEVEMRMGPDGVPTQLFLHETHDANRWIEEFMIAANLAVGAEAKRRGLPILFRVHGEPDLSAIDEFLEVLFTLLPGTRPTQVDTIPHLRAFLGGLPSSALTRVLHRFFLRSMKKAHYSGQDIGHFGLGVDGYSHFTSPIRRYPDLWTHRRLGEWLRGARVQDDHRDRVESIGQVNSRAEVRAEEAEREMKKLLSARFAEGRLGEEHDGHVVALTARGLFVELVSFPLEGFLPREALPDGLRFVQERMAWVDSRARWELRPGDKVRVQIVRVDLRARRTTFGLVAVAPPGPKRRGGPAGQRAGRSRGPRGAARAAEAGSSRSSRRGPKSAGSKPPGAKRPSGPKKGGRKAGGRKKR